MGFTLRIINAPSGSVSWKADFAARSFDYDPIADSGWMGISQVWDYPSDPRGATTLRILIIDAQSELLLYPQNLGPVNNGQDYEYNCATGQLTGITAEPPPVFHLAFVDTIFSAVWDISAWFLSAHQEVSGWIWPFYYLQYPLYGLHSVSWSMLTPIAHFGDWADDVAAKVSQVLTLEQITAYFSAMLTYATAAWDWVQNATWNVWYIVEDWWSSTQFIVLGWIDTATEGLAGLLEAWDNFRVTTLPTLVSFTWLDTWWNGRLTEVSSLIDSWFKSYEPFWAGWQDFRDKVALFFEDPLEFLWSLFADWFLGPEE